MTCDDCTPRENVFGEQPEEDEFWRARFRMISPYNSKIDCDFRAVAGMIVEAGSLPENDRHVVTTDDIAERLTLSIEYVELIQTMLADVRYPRVAGKFGGDYYPSPFTYGTSPRGLFLDDRETAKRFLEEFDEHLRRTWGPDPEV